MHADCCLFLLSFHKAPASDVFKYQCFNMNTFGTLNDKRVTISNEVNTCGIVAVKRDLTMFTLEIYALRTL